MASLWDLFPDYEDILRSLQDYGNSPHENYGFPNEQQPGQNRSDFLDSQDAARMSQMRNMGRSASKAAAGTLNDITSGNIDIGPLQPLINDINDPGGLLKWLYSAIPDSGETRAAKGISEAERRLAESEAKTQSMRSAKEAQHSQSQTDTAQALQQLLAQSHGAAPQDVFAAHGDAPVMRGGGDQGMSMGAYSKSLRPVSQQGFIKNHQGLGLDDNTLSLLAEAQDNPQSSIIPALLELVKAHQEQNRAINQRDILESKGSPQTAALLLKLLLTGKLE